MPAVKLYEDAEAFAFLDIFPQVIGQALIIPKKHMTSKALEAPEEVVEHLCQVARKLNNPLKIETKSDRIIVVFEGLDVPHLHMKLFPYNGRCLAKLPPAPKSPIPAEKLEKIAKRIRKRMSLMPVKHE